ncbi:MAG: hypothetical protein H7Y05_14945, partial [Steroidobacteraceae bacterium]|nr:hypothetical protein [Deltaproteobacteria bacterium]
MTLTELVTGKVKDDSGKLGLGDIDAGVAEAIKRYSKVRPQIVCADLAGAGSNDLPLPVDWSPEFSSIVSIEYPL